LYAARLVDEQRTGAPAQAQQAQLLLEILTPIVKSWPSEWCLEANSLAIQIHGGYGYTRDFPVEQFWRDNRLNMIHEGTHGIQAMDLLGRKVLMQEGKAMQLLVARMLDTVARARNHQALSDHAQALEHAVAELTSCTQAAWQGQNPSVTLANAVPYLQGFGHVVLAWVWLDLALTLVTLPTSAAVQGRLACLNFFFRYELPKIGAWLAVVRDRDTTCLDLSPEAF
jgi:butyryl-CoA dehydrogenase